MDTSWSKLPKPLNSVILETLHELSFNFMTPVQAACIPLMLDRKDVVAEAITGSGKTLAFLVPMLQIMIDKRDSALKHDIFAIIISPTRDLAQQTYNVLKAFLNKIGRITCRLVMGGSDTSSDMDVFREDGFNIIIGTPGKLRALLEKHSNLQFIKGIKALEMLILDEADQLLDMGFKLTIDIILKHLPKQRRTSLFTATQSWQIDELVRAGLRNPVSVQVKNYPNSITNSDVHMNTDTTLTKKSDIKINNLKVNSTTIKSNEITSGIILDACSITTKKTESNENNTLIGRLDKKNKLNIKTKIKRSDMYDDNECKIDLSNSSNKDISANSLSELTTSLNESKNVENQRTPMQLVNGFMICNSDEKFNQLVSFLKTNSKKKNLIFFSTCACVDYFSKLLIRFLPNINILSIHSKKENRKNIISKFRNLKDCSLLCTDVMGRGIDVPDIDTVLQFDPPSTASNFVHRCGRTARMGRSGRAIVFLRPHEQVFVDFLLINQKVPLQKMELFNTEENYLNKIICISKTDRSIYEKGLQAFVSFIQSYNKHECSMIFRLKDLDLGLLGTGFGLLHLPRMPEIKNIKYDNFVLTHFNYNEIPYLNSQDEERRLKRNVEGNKKLNKKSEFRKNERTIGTKQKRKHMHNNNNKDYIDLDELLKDAKLVKRLKLGKISKEEFDFAIDC